MPATVESSSMAEESRARGSADTQGRVLDCREDPRRAVRATALGISADVTCGVRDYATLLARGLGEENVSCSSLWLERSQESLLAARKEVRSWTRGFAAELADERPGVVLLHYSVFSYSYR